MFGSSLRQRIAVLPSDFAQWSAPDAQQPQPGDYPFDLDWSLSSTVSLRARAPEDAFTAATLGVERFGHGVLINDDDVVLTIGYLVTEAEQVWLTTGEGRVIQGHVLGVDAASGFGLVKALEPLAIPPMPLGQSRDALLNERVILAAGGQRRQSIAAQIVARQPFAGYWEYALDEALFTTPAHPLWSGAALVGPTGKLLGLCSLRLEQQIGSGKIEPLNMSVPIDLLPPVLDALIRGGQDLPRRPWLGVYAQMDEDQVVIIGAAEGGPADRAGVRQGDVVRAVAGVEVTDLAGFYHAVWALGSAGVQAPLTLEREGDVFDVTLTSRDRARHLKPPRLH